MKERLRYRLKQMEGSGAVKDPDNYPRPEENENDEMPEGRGV